MKKIRKILLIMNFQKSWFFESCDVCYNFDRSQQVAKWRTLRHSKSRDDHQPIATH